LLDLTLLPLNALVAVRLRRDASSAYRDNLALTVTSVPRWQGLANPAGTGDALLFAAYEGSSAGVGELGAMPFTIEQAKLASCVDAGDEEIDALRVGGAASGEPIELAMGETGELMASGSRYRVRDVRSWSSSASSHDDAMAFWAIRRP
jgi:hypothetical protein